MNALELCDLTVRFGGLVAVNEFSLSVKKGTVHSLIGPNGAGKTTVINTITGLYPASHGSIRVSSQEVLGRRPHEISALGVARTFQNTEMFGEMTVLDNVLVGAHSHARYGLLSSIVRSPGYLRYESAIRDRARDLLHIVGLSGEQDMAAANLPFGKQRTLELARALASGPDLLLLDEPAAGLRAGEIDHLSQSLLNVRDQHGVTILLVDHVMKVVMDISDRITVLNFGEKIAEGTAREVRSDPEVRRAYLGDDPDRA